MTVRVRKSDLAVLKSIVEPAIADYKAIMKREVKQFAKKEVPCAVLIDEARYLPEYDANNAKDSCIGGILLHCRKGRIVCSNTLDERLKLCY